MRGFIHKKAEVLQLGFIIFASIFFHIFTGEGFVGVFFGGLISLNNAYLIHRISIKQKSILINSASVALRLMVFSVIVRFFMVSILMLFGFKLNLNPLAMIVGLSVGQIGFLIDKIRTKNGE